MCGALSQFRSLTQVLCSVMSQWDNIRNALNERLNNNFTILRYRLQSLECIIGSFWLDFLSNIFHWSTNKSISSLFYLTSFISHWSSSNERTNLCYYKGQICIQYFLVLIMLAKYYEDCTTSMLSTKLERRKCFLSRDMLD